MDTSGPTWSNEVIPSTYSAGGTVSVEIRFIDSGGISRVTAFFGPRANNITIGFSASSPLSLASGTNKNGIWRGNLQIPAGTTGSQYVGFEALDESGNSSRPAYLIQAGTPLPTISLSKGTSSISNVFVLTVLNGKGPFIYEWNIVRPGGDLTRYLSSTSQSSSTISLDTALTALEGRPTFKEPTSGLNGPYDNSLSIYVNFIDKGSIGEGNGWWVKESNRLTIGP